MESKNDSNTLLRFPVILVFSCLLFVRSFAQQPLIDSLEIALKHPPSNKVSRDTMDIRIWINLSNAYKGIDNEKGMFFAEKALKQCQVRAGNPAIDHLHVEAMAAHAGFNILLGNYAAAEKELKKALKTNEKASPKASNGLLYHNLGTSQYIQGNHEKAVEYYIMALEQYQKEQYFDRISRTYNNLGLIQKDLGNLDKSTAYLQKAIHYSRQQGEEILQADGYLNLGVVYQEQKKYSEAVKVLNKALRFYEKLGYTAGIGRVMTNLGLCCEQQRKFDEAISYNKRALAIGREINDPRSIVTTLNNLGFCYFRTEQLDQAMKCYEEGLKIAESTGNMPTMERIHGNMADVFYARKNYQKAYDHQELASLYEDTLFNENMSEQIADMQTKYETEKKEKENLQLQQKTTRQQTTIRLETQKRTNQLMLGIVLFILTIGVAAFVVNRRKLRQKVILANALAEEEKLRFKSVIEAEEKERSRIAQELHDGLGQLLSAARLNVAGLEDAIGDEDQPFLERSLKIMDDACTEVRHISHNMMPSALIRLGLIPAINELAVNVTESGKLKLEFTTNAEGSFGTSLDITIYRIVQEVVNNMIRHAQASLINLDITKQGNELFIRMKDNGIGFNTKRIQESKGLGWKNIFSRVSLIDGTIELDSNPGQGTIVFIKLQHGEQSAD